MIGQHHGIPVQVDVHDIAIPTGNVNMRRVILYIHSRKQRVEWNKGIQSGAFHVGTVGKSRIHSSIELSALAALSPSAFLPTAFFSQTIYLNIHPTTQVLHTPLNSILKAH